jgi:TonB family protein
VGAAGFGDANAPAAPAAATRAATASPAGFGSGRADTTRPVARPQIASTEFDSVAAPPAPNSPKPPSTSSDRAFDLEILEKPRPEYTEEARRLRIEGEVSIQVLFEASSRIRVLRIVSGLGHGLDENAAKAAVAIRFRPATQSGRAIDTIAVIRIRFQLAY